GVRVQVARDVARRAGVAVVPPGAAEVRRPLEKRDVREAVVLKLDRGRDPAQTAAHDDDRWISGFGHGVNLPPSRLHGPGGSIAGRVSATLNPRRCTHIESYMGISLERSSDGDGGRA